MANWLVTGGAGFIGSHLTEHLVGKKQSVRIIDDFSTGRMDNLSAVRNKIEVIRGDICDQRVVKRALEDIDYVLHQAARRSVVRSLEDPVATNEVNVQGTVNLLWGALKSGVKRFVYASSSSVYGDSRKFPQSPSDPPSPLSPYAVSKLAGEYYCRVFSKTLGLETVCLRYFNVFGYRQDPNSKYAVVIPIFMKSILRDKPLPLQGDGRQSRDFAHVDNVVSANILAAKKKGVSGEVFNVACGKNHSLLDYIRILEKITKRKLKVGHAPSRNGDVRKTWADIRKTQKRLGYNPLVEFEEGIKRTWFQQFHVQEKK